MEKITKKRFKELHGNLFVVAIANFDNSAEQLRQWQGLEKLINTRELLPTSHVDLSDSKKDDITYTVYKLILENHVAYILELKYWDKWDNIYKYNSILYVE